MKYFLYVEADTNDGDMIGELKPITMPHYIKLLPLIKAIKKKNGKWGKYEMCDTDNDPEILYKDFGSKLIDEMNDYIPSGDHGIHSIDTIKLLEVNKTKTLL